ncbi:hypothetical protein T492DRAFT_357735 [Pavlovales sp. CCMP2436]|nr:hypothetical protein T492DRAFT_357735 [Pavlovales sp. CCMP2436]
MSARPPPPPCGTGARALPQLKPEVFYGAGAPKRPTPSLADLPPPPPKRRAREEALSRWAAFSMQDEALARARAAGDEARVWAHELSSTGARSYIVASVCDFWSVYRTLRPMVRRHYELIEADRPCRLYFDLEFALRPELPSEAAPAEVAPAAMPESSEPALPPGVSLMAQIAFRGGVRREPRAKVADAERADTGRTDTGRADTGRADTERADTERADTDGAATEGGGADEAMGGDGPAAQPERPAAGQAAAAVAAAVAAAGQAAAGGSEQPRTDLPHCQAALAAFRRLLAAELRDSLGLAIDLKSSTGAVQGGSGDGGCGGGG